METKLLIRDPKPPSGCEIRATILVCRLCLPTISNRSIFCQINLIDDLMHSRSHLLTAQLEVNNY